MATVIYRHAEPADRFYVRIVDGKYAYATIKIRNPFSGNDVYIFTPNGINNARDYLVEFRDALQGAIDTLTKMDEACKEAE